MMKRTRIGWLILLLPLLAFSQYRSDPAIPDLGLRKSSNNMPGSRFLNPDRLQIQNSYSMQVGSYGKQTTALGVFRSTFDYYINPQVQVRGSIGILHQPFQTPNQAGPMGRTPGMDLNNLLLGGQVIYRPTENMVFQLGFSRQPIPAVPNNPGALRRW